MQFNNPGDYINFITDYAENCTKFPNNVTEPEFLKIYEGYTSLSKPAQITVRNFVENQVKTVATISNMAANNRDLALLIANNNTNTLAVTAAIGSVETAAKRNHFWSAFANLIRKGGDFNGSYYYSIATAALAFVGLSVLNRGVKPTDSETA